jgi:iron complex transport system ATP-binding protein
MNRLLVRGLAMGYGERQVLRDIDLDVVAGELVGLVGPNGAGKSSLLRCLAGMHPVATGTVELDGEVLAKLGARAIAQRLAVVPQTCVPALPISVAQFVGMGRYARERFFGGPTPHDEAVVQRCLGDLALQAFADRAIDALSGGEFRRVLIAQALTQEPGLLLLDEPVQQLDLLHQLEVMEFARAFTRRPGQAGLVVLHELNLAARFCDRVVLLHGGKALAHGTPAEVFTVANLRHTYGVEVVLGRCPSTGALLITPVAAATASSVSAPGGA